MTTPHMQQIQKAQKDVRNEYLLTTNGVMIVGYKMLGEKLAALLCEVLNMIPESNVSTVVIRDDNYPQIDGEPVFGAAYPDTNSMAVNLEHCWNRAVEAVQEDDCHLSLLACVWINVLSVFGHELDHLHVATADREDYEIRRLDDDGNTELEEAAIHESVQSIIRLALQFDIEIPAINEMGWFAAKIMELFMKDDEWINVQKLYAERGVIYDKPWKEEELCMSMREYIKRAYPNASDKDWGQPTSAVN